VTRLFRDYLTERVRPAVFLPVLAGIWVAALWASGGEGNAGRQTLALLLLAFLLLQFRLWDDLEDVEHDRRVHPDRVLVRTSTRPFRGLLAALVVAALAVAAVAGPAVVATLTTLDVLFLVAYRLVRTRVPDLVWRFPVLLLKYPAFVLLSAMAAGITRPDPRLAAAMLAAMAGACLYELLHDQRHPTGARS